MAVSVTPIVDFGPVGEASVPIVFGNNNATDSHIPGHDLAHGSVNGDGIGSDCNMTTGGANTKVSNCHVPINKQNRVPLVNLFKNRMANVNHKLHRGQW